MKKKRALGPWLMAGAVVLSIASQVEAQTIPSAPVILINRESGQCAVVPNDAAAQGLKLNQQPCRGAAGESWAMQPVPGGYRIASRLDGLCLGVVDRSLADGAAVEQRACNGDAAQTWIAQVDEGWVDLVASHSGLCLSVDGSPRTAGATLIQAGCAYANRQRWTVSDAPLPSAWSGVIKLPLVPAAAAGLPNGKILTWSAYQPLGYGGDHGLTKTAIFTPATQKSTQATVSNTGHDMFCPGTAQLADGRVLVNGGSSSAKTSIFDPGPGVWTTASQMSIPRGYEGDTLLPSGEVLTLGGSWNGGRGGKDAEVWNERGGWRRLPGVPVEPFIGPDPAGVYRGDNHLWLQAWRDGWVFHAGPAARMHWIDTSGQGGVLDAGPRGDDAYAINGNAVAYDTGRILTLGGAPAYNDGASTDAAYLIDIRGGPSQPVGLRKLAPMTFPRSMHNSVVLPNGQVVIVGGLNTSLPFSDTSPVLMAELWDPKSERFVRLSPMKTPRSYHSVALLLFDGRVLVGGGGLCGRCLVNHPNVEILTPPYLLNADGSAAARPTILSAPYTTTWGRMITVRTNRTVKSFALMRLGTATHSLDNDQRRIPLTIRGGSPASGYRMIVPDDRGTVLAGNYMLFALDLRDTPSVASPIAVR